MLRFAALNESDSGEEESDQQDEPTTTKEAEEAEAFALYNRALGLERAGDRAGAEELFCGLLEHPFLLKAQQIAHMEEENRHHPGLPLLYLVYKNIALSAVANGNLVDAMKAYVEAVKIDGSEVTVWYKMGTLAKQLHNYPLAKLAFEQGLQCNERHWPSLDAVISLLYALNDYWMCLDYCSRALERDPYYTKGLVFMRQVLKEQPSLSGDTKDMFTYCDPIIHTVTVETSESEQMIKECIKIREKRRQLAKKPDPVVLKLPKPITELTWKCIGECLVALFDDFTSSSPTKSLVLPLDMSEYTAVAEGTADLPQVTKTTTAITTTTTASPSSADSHPAVSSTSSTAVTTTYSSIEAIQVSSTTTAISITTSTTTTASSTGRTPAVSQPARVTPQTLQPDPLPLTSHSQSSSVKNEKSIGGASNESEVDAGETKDIEMVIKDKDTEIVRTDTKDIEMVSKDGKVSELVSTDSKEPDIVSTDAKNPKSTTAKDNEIVDGVSKNSETIIGSEKTDGEMDTMEVGRAEGQTLDSAAEAKDKSVIMGSAVDSEQGEQPMEVDLSSHTENTASDSKDSSIIKQDVKSSSEIKPEDVDLKFEPLNETSTTAVEKEMTVGDKEVKKVSTDLKKETDIEMATEIKDVEVTGKQTDDSSKQTNDSGKETSMSETTSTMPLLSTEKKESNVTEETSTVPTPTTVPSGDAKPDIKPAISGQELSVTTSLIPMRLGQVSTVGTSTSTPSMEGTDGSRPIQADPSSHGIVASQGIGISEGVTTAQGITISPNIIFSQAMPASQNVPVTHSDTSSLTRTASSESDAQQIQTSTETKVTDIGTLTSTTAVTSSAGVFTTASSSVPVTVTSHAVTPVSVVTDTVMPVTETKPQKSPGSCFLDHDDDVEMVDEQNGNKSDEITEDQEEQKIDEEKKTKEQKDQKITGEQQETTEKQQIRESQQLETSETQEHKISEKITEEQEQDKITEGQEEKIVEPSSTTSQSITDTHTATSTASGLTSTHKSVSNTGASSTTALDCKQAGSEPVPSSTAFATESKPAESKLVSETTVETDDLPTSPLPSLSCPAVVETLSPSIPEKVSAPEKTCTLEPSSAEEKASGLEISSTAEKTNVGEDVSAMPTKEFATENATTQENTFTPEKTSTPKKTSAPENTSFSEKTSTPEKSPPSQAGSGRPTAAPHQPKFQFNTITAQEVQDLLQDCVPSTPLLTTPAPSSYSSSLVERFKQAAAATTTTTSTTSTAAKATGQAPLTSQTSTTSTATTTTAAPSVPDAPASSDVVMAESAADGDGVAVVSPTHQGAVVSSSVAARAGMGRGGKGRRGVKRKRAPVERKSKVIGPEDYGMKRRSARVTRKTRKEEENVDIQKLLHNFLPASLIEAAQEEEESQTEESEAASQIPADLNLSELCGGPPLSETEHQDVRNYLKECVKSQGVVGLMYKYLVQLAIRDNRTWPPGVAELYLQVYERARDHLTFPSLYCMDFPEICYIELSKMALVWSELVLDGYLVKSAEVASPVTHHRPGSERSPSDSGLFTDAHSEADLLFVYGMVESGLVELLAQQQAQFTIRAYWMKGRLALAENQMDEAFDTLDLVGNYLREEEGVSKVYLPNCQHNKLVCVEEVKRLQESLKRCHSLEESQRLFEAEEYQEVIEALTSTFTLPHSQHHVIEPALPERQAQLELLQDALYQQEDWRLCWLWGEVVLNEALHHYRRAPTVATRESWASSLVRILEALQRVLDREGDSMRLLSMRSAYRLSQNLISIIEIIHDVSDSVTDMPINSVLPWMLLYRIIRQEEDKVELTKAGEEDDDSRSSSEDNLPSSLMVLSRAHDYLGRNAWCTRECGIFLLFFVDVMTTEFTKGSDSVNEDLETAFEQCVFCLYGHPNKKSKARHLVDHNAPCIELMWEHCEAVFEYFKPKALPEFDSYKTSTVSAELHHLLRRIYLLIPDMGELSPRVSQVHQFIDGTISAVPAFTCSCMILKELYYLMADYYFKNQEQLKAIKFYTYDVCYNPSRIDSWAGLALAKTAQLQQKLDAMELKIDTPVHKKSMAALRCFRQAVEIDESVRLLWIEYGALAYQLHSHASRQLRMKIWFPLTPEQLDVAMETRVEMLGIARNCYWKASKCEVEGREEEWLHHYMMGKVMEKQRAHPRAYLEHYKQAAIYLHEEEAKYPRKIIYNTTPPHLSLEALEMYYRLHVAVMKHLLRVSSAESKEDMTLFDRYLTEATESPFALRREKHHDVQESVSSADDSQSSATSVAPYSLTLQKPVYHLTPQDHTYSKQKSSSGETSDGSCEVRDSAMETDGSQGSQSSEEPDPAAKTSRDTDRQIAGKTDSVREGEGRRKENEAGDQSSHVDMVELHAETDSQVSSQSFISKPLLVDKQVSGGFVPTLDQHLSLVGSASKPLPPDSAVTPSHTTTTSTAASTIAVRNTDTSQEDEKKKKLSDEAPVLLIDKARGAIPMDFDATQLGNDSGKAKDMEGITSTVSGRNTSEKRDEQSAETTKESKRSKAEDARDPATNSDTSLIVISSSSELSQDEDATDAVHAHTSHIQSPIMVLSSENEQPGSVTPLKRRLNEPSESSKRRRLDVEDAEKTGDDGGTSQPSLAGTSESCVIEVSSQESELTDEAERTAGGGRSSPKTSLTHEAMEVDMDTDAGKEMQDAGKEPQDAGKEPQDAGKEPQDAGKEKQDAGKEMQDAGKEMQDAGKEPQDAGKEMQDAGKEPQDAGKEPQDAGKEPQDAGKSVQKLELPDKVSLTQPDRPAGKPGDPQGKTTDNAADKSADEDEDKVADKDEDKAALKAEDTGCVVKDSDKAAAVTEDTEPSRLCPTASLEVKSEQIRKEVSVPAATEDMDMETCHSDKLTSASVATEINSSTPATAEVTSPKPINLDTDDENTPALTQSEQTRSTSGKSEEASGWKLPHQGMLVVDKTEVKEECSPGQSSPVLSCPPASTLSHDSCQPSTVDHTAPCQQHDTLPEVKLPPPLPNQTLLLTQGQAEAPSKRPTFTGQSEVKSLTPDHHESKALSEVKNKNEQATSSAELSTDMDMREEKPEPTLSQPGPSTSPQSPGSCQPQKPSVSNPAPSQKPSVSSPSPSLHQDGHQSSAGLGQREKKESALSKETEPRSVSPADNSLQISTVTDLEQKPCTEQSKSNTSPATVSPEQKENESTCYPKQESGANFYQQKIEEDSELKSSVTESKMPVNTTEKSTKNPEQKTSDAREQNCTNPSENASQTKASKQADSMNELADAKVLTSTAPPSSVSTSTTATTGSTSSAPSSSSSSVSTSTVSSTAASTPSSTTTASAAVSSTSAASTPSSLTTASSARSTTSAPPSTSSSSAVGEQKPPASSQPSSQSTCLGEKEYREWKRALLNKCVEGLHVCLSRFPTHYKSLYRLAYLYYASDTHRNLEMARDLLLGNHNWHNLPYMPANGLFSDRKANNFFNGTWKIPIDEIDRAGSFASHVNRSVQLLLEVLRDLGDVSSLLQVHHQLKKKPPDQARKYLRDGERQILARMAHIYSLGAVEGQLCRPESEVDSTEVLLSAFRAYNSHRFGPEPEAKQAKMLLIAAYQRMGLPKHGYGSPLEQAMQCCNMIMTNQALAQKAERARLLQQCGSSMFSQSSHGSSLPAPSPNTVDTGTGPSPSFTPSGRPQTMNTGIGPSPSFTPSGRSQTVNTGAGPSPSFPPSGRSNTGTGPSSNRSHTINTGAGPSPSARLNTGTGSSSSFTPSGRSQTINTGSGPSPAFSGGRSSMDQGTGPSNRHNPPWAGGQSQTAGSPSSVQSSRPGYVPGSRQRTMSASQSESPAMSDVRGMTRQLSSDLSPPGRPVPRMLHAAGHRSPVPLPHDVIDLTSPEKDPEPRPVQMFAAGQLPRTGPGVGLRFPGGPRPSQHPRLGTRNPTGTLAGSPRFAGSVSGGMMRGASQGRGGFAGPSSRGMPMSPTHPRPSRSPFSSPNTFYPSSAASTPPTPRPHDGTDIDLTSDQEDDLALTPDRLTLDVHHHFHRDLM